MAIEGKIPASGPISFGAVRGFLGENDPNYTCYVNTAIIGYFQKYLKRIPDEAGALYWQSVLENGTPLATIENLIATSLEAQVVASVGAAVATVGNAENYNMNRDMFRVITKTNANQPIKASDLRSKDNSVKEYNSPWMVNIIGRPATQLTPKIFLNSYFSGDNFRNGDTIKISTYSATEPDPDRYANWVYPPWAVINWFIQIGTYFNLRVQNASGRKRHNTILYYDPADNSIQIQGQYTGASSKSKQCQVAIIRIEYIPHLIVSNFYQYYDAGIDHFKANHD
jgi:hypothetical protein